MAYKTVSNDLIKKQYEKYLASQKVEEDKLDANYKELRDFCIEKYYGIKKRVENESSYKSKLHQLDLEFGLCLYRFLNSQLDFNSKYEVDYSFWKYVAVFVIPDIIADRWNIDKSAHFYSKATAVYPFQVYWYVNMGWQGTEEETISVLKDNQEDQILQLVDRQGSIGVNLELYRKIMKKVSSVTQNRQDVFRKVMAKNTSKLINLRPEIYPGGVDEYVEMLFK